MKMRHSVKWMLVGVLSLPNLTACSFGGSDEEAEEVEATDEGEAANAEEGEGNETAAVEGAEATEGAESNVANADGNVAFDDANSGNTAGAEGGVASNDIPPELLNSENPATLGAEGTPTDTSAMGAEGNLATNPAPDAMPSDVMPATDAVPAATDAVAAAPAAAAPVAEVPSGDMRVYYVNVSSVAILNGPSASAQSVGTLKKGDPVLVKIEGAYANVLNRGYVEVASLSQAPVGRSTSGAKSWH